MKHVVFLACVLFSVPALADRTVTGDSGSFDCRKDPVVVIQHGDGDYTFTGTCDKIVVNGGDNKLTIENVKKLSLVGTDNKVTVQGADKIGVTGSDNVVTYKGTVSGKGKVAVASVGTGNKITKR